MLGASAFGGFSPAGDGAYQGVAPVAATVSSTSSASMSLTTVLPFVVASASVSSVSASMLTAAQLRIASASVSQTAARATTSVPVGGSACVSLSSAAMTLDALTPPSFVGRGRVAVPVGAWY